MRDSWKVLKLGELCDVVSGYGFPMKFQSNTDKKIPFLKVSDMNLPGNEIVITKSNHTVSEEDLKEMKAKAFPKDTIIFPKIGAAIATNKKRLTSQVSTFDNNVMGLVKKSDLINFQYLFIWIQNFNLSEWASDSELPSMRKSRVEQEDIPVPPLAEQMRIVKILNEKFDAIKKLKDNTEKQLTIARELYEGQLNQICQKPSDNSQLVRLDEVSMIVSKLVDPKDAKYQNLIHIGAGNIEQKTGKLSDLKTAGEERLISGKFLFDEGTVLYSKIRPYLMKVARPKFSGLCSADVYPLVADKKVLNEDFLFYILLSKTFTDYAIKGSARAGMPKVNRDHLFAFTFHLPSLNRQEQIAKELQALSEKTMGLERIFQSMILALDELKKSYLEQAFAGKL